MSSTCLIAHDHDCYSVPSSFANQPVSVRVYATRLAVVADARIVAEHERVFIPDYTTISKTVYDLPHYLGVVRRKPGVVRNGTPFAELPDGFVRLTGFAPKSRQIAYGYSMQFQWLSLMEKCRKQPTIS